MCNDVLKSVSANDFLHQSLQRGLCKINSESGFLNSANAVFLEKVYFILARPLALRRFPTFCAALVGGYTLLQLPLRLAYDFAGLLTPTNGRKLVQTYNARYLVPQFIAGFLSAWFSLHLLNSREKAHPSTFLIGRSQSDSADHPTKGNSEANFASITGPTNSSETSTCLAGKTVDLTILSATRAFDTAVVNLWRHLQQSGHIRPSHCTISSIVSQYADTLVFALSSGIVMWSWFYLPDCLPPAYNAWISEAAQVDVRLIALLREARAGRFNYGEKSDKVRHAKSMCEEYRWPSEWGDPEKTIPIPCEMVHMGVGPSCHWHAAVQFFRAFKFALATNLPLQLIAKARNPSLRTFRVAAQEALRSSTFLGAFVGLFYYGVCLSRTRLGPKLFSRDKIAPITWDSGLCVGAGCSICGWSILLENGRRRSEVAMFVAPRALATFLPRKYEAKVRPSCATE